MISLQDAKKLICKERHDSFVNDGDHESDVMLCKWRTDSFEHVDNVESLQTGAERDFESNCASSPSAGQSFNCPSSPVRGQSFSSSPGRQSMGRRIDRRYEVALLESLRANGLASETEQGYMSPRLAKTRRNVSTIAVPSTQAAPERETQNQERYDAMQRIAREAAIREALEREMTNACNAGVNFDSNVQVATAPLSRSWERARLGQPSPRKSPHQSPHRSPLPLQRSTSNPTAQRAGSFDSATVTRIAGHFPTAHSFSQTPPIRIPSFLQGAGWSAGSVRRSTSFSSGSPARKRISSFDLTTRRGTSPSRTIRHITSPRRATDSSPQPIERLASPQVVMGRAVVQQTANAVHAQADAPHSNKASETINNASANRSVIDESKRLTHLHSLREPQQQRYRQQDQQLNSPHVKPSTFLTPQSPQSSCFGQSDIFWTPPPEAMPVCSQSPRLDGRGLTTLGASPCSPAMRSVALSEMTEQSLPHVVQQGLPVAI